MAAEVKVVNGDTHCYLQSLKIRLKTWEKEFLAKKKRKPTRSDIDGNPIRVLYKEYETLKAGSRSKVPSSPKTRTRTSAISSLSARCNAEKRFKESYCTEEDHNSAVESNLGSAAGPLQTSRLCPASQTLTVRKSFLTKGASGSQGRIVKSDRVSALFVGQCADRVRTPALPEKENEIMVADDEVLSDDPEDQHEIGASKERGKARGRAPFSSRSYKPKFVGDLKTLKGRRGTTSGQISGNFVRLNLGKRKRRGRLGANGKRRRKNDKAAWQSRPANADDHLTAVVNEEDMQNKPASTKGPSEATPLEEPLVPVKGNTQPSSWYSKKCWNGLVDEVKTLITDVDAFSGISMSVMLDSILLQEVTKSLSGGELEMCAPTSSKTPVTAAALARAMHDVQKAVSFVITRDEGEAAIFASSLRSLKCVSLFGKAYNPAEVALVILPAFSFVNNFGLSILRRLRSSSDFSVGYIACLSFKRSTDDMHATKAYELDFAHEFIRSQDIHPKLLIEMTSFQPSNSLYSCEFEAHIHPGNRMQFRESVTESIMKLPKPVLVVCPGQSLCEQIATMLDTHSDLRACPRMSRRGHSNRHQSDTNDLQHFTEGKVDVLCTTRCPRSFMFSATQIASVVFTGCIPQGVDAMDLACAQNVQEKDLQVQVILNVDLVRYGVSVASMVVPQPLAVRKFVKMVLDQLVDKEWCQIEKHAVTTLLDVHDWKLQHVWNSLAQAGIRSWPGTWTERFRIRLSSTEGFSATLSASAQRLLNHIKDNTEQTAWVLGDLAQSVEQRVESVWIDLLVLRDSQKISFDRDGDPSFLLTWYNKSFITKDRAALEGEIMDSILAGPSGVSGIDPMACTNASLIKLCKDCPPDIRNILSISEVQLIQSKLTSAEGMVESLLTDSYPGDDNFDVTPHVLRLLKQHKLSDRQIVAVLHGLPLPSLNPPWTWRKDAAWGRGLSYGHKRLSRLVKFLFKHGVLKSENTTGK
eukprot:Clim_evm67s207 gene=Clim_evmTU67s207